MTLDEARDHIGHGVVYATGYAPPEEGVITGVSASLVFVRYRDQLHSKGTDPADLTLLADAARTMPPGDKTDAATAAGTEN